MWGVLGDGDGVGGDEEDLEDVLRMVVRLGVERVNRRLRCCTSVFCNRLERWVIGRRVASIVLSSHVEIQARKNQVTCQFRFRKSQKIRYMCRRRQHCDDALGNSSGDSS